MAIRHLIIDMDGVLWRGAQVIPGAPEFIRFLRERGIGFVLATNNSTKTVEQYVDKLVGFGMAVAPHEIITSAVATADYLATLAGPGTPVYVIGGQGLRQSLADGRQDERWLQRYPARQVSTAEVQIFPLDSSVWRHPRTQALPELQRLDSPTRHVSARSIVVGHAYSLLTWLPPAVGPCPCR